MPLASSGDSTGNSIGRVLASESTSNAVIRIAWNESNTRHEGSIASTQRYDMKVANASLSQIPFHQRIVTRSPNHMWASSWATVSATSRRSSCAACAGSSSSSVSR